MNSWIYLSIAVGTIVLIASVVISMRCERPKGELFRFEETKALFLMTGLAVLLGYGILVYKLIDPSVGGSEKGSYGMIAVVGLVAILMAAYTILFALNKKIYVYDDRLVISDVFGKTKDIYWEDINTVERPGMQRAARFNCAGDVSFTVSGANKNYKKFMNFLEPKLKGNKGKKLLAQIERNLK
ncbi:MAG: hypothetical protein IIZ33_05145 [Erysipelotrichaceae bacterium]|nr:hypothetical protein [Erysipelotrichaceae bacterium]